MVGLVVVESLLAAMLVGEIERKSSTCEVEMSRRAKKFKIENRHRGKSAFVPGSWTNA